MQIPKELFGRHVVTERPNKFSSNGRRGWWVRIPGDLPLATPAVDNGKVFLGGGFGGYDFFALDALTGRLAWHYQTNDDGPTAAAVEDGHVVFNTESCELEVLTVEGRPVWKQWLGDPLTSMPAVGGGRVFMSYPSVSGDKLACFDLRTGAPLWETPLSAAVITAPVLAEERVFFATVQGMLYCLEQSNGQVVWEEEANATSAPVVLAGQCYYSRREAEEVEVDGKRVQQQAEYASSSSSKFPQLLRRYGSTYRRADYLDAKKRAARSMFHSKSDLIDAAVGFAIGKGAMQTNLTEAHLGLSQVSRMWAFQGSKPFAYEGRLYSSMGDSLQCTDLDRDVTYWKKEFYGKSAEESEETADNELTPPALCNGKVFVATTRGDVFCLSAREGEELWRVHLGGPIVYQPAIAGGRLYVGDDSGRLYCVETGDSADDGWLMWGATPAHNGLAEPSSDPDSRASSDILIGVS
jgi:outer membrane protein assembly factor BamB